MGKDTSIKKKRKTNTETSEQEVDIYKVQIPREFLIIFTIIKLFSRKLLSMKRKSLEVAQALLMQKYFLIYVVTFEKC